MKELKLRQLIRELIKEAYVDSKGELKRFNADEFGGDFDQEFALWVSGIQRGLNALKSAPEGAQIQKHLKALKEYANETADMLNWLTEEEIERLFNQIPGNSVEDKGIVGMIGGAMRYYEEQGDEFLFETFIVPHIQNKFPFMRDDNLGNLMEGLGKRLKDVGGMIVNLFRKKPRG